MKHFLKRKLIAAFFIAVFSIQSPCFATVVKKIRTDDYYYKPSTWAEEPAYIDRAFGKMTYGIYNFFMGPLAIVKEPYESAVLGDSVIVGLGRGVLYGVADIVGGFLNFVTFPITALKIPLPEGGIDSREF